MHFQISLNSIFGQKEGITVAQVPLATRIDLTDDGVLVNTITDPETLCAILSIVNQQSDSFAIPWYGIPVSNLHLHIYAGACQIAHYTIGTNFIGRIESITGNSQWLIRYTDRRILMALRSIAMAAATTAEEMPIE